MVLADLVGGADDSAHWWVAVLSKTTKSCVKFFDSRHLFPLDLFLHLFVHSFSFSLFLMCSNFPVGKQSRKKGLFYNASANCVCSVPLQLSGGHFKALQQAEVYQVEVHMVSLVT